MEMDNSGSQAEGQNVEQPDDDSDWEESLVYVDLDDIPNVQELFAYDPDDFLLSQSKRQREEQPKDKKPTRPYVNLKFYNLDDDHPILQIGDRFYLGKFEEPFGTHLLFREKPSGTEPQQDSNDQDPLRDGTQPTSKTVLTSLIPDMDPPLNPVFGNHKYCTNDYELIANVHKVLKMTRRNVMRREKETDVEIPTRISVSVPVGDDDEPELTLVAHIGTLGDTN